MGRRSAVGLILTVGLALQFCAVPAVSAEGRGFYDFSALDAGPIPEEFLPVEAWWREDPEMRWEIVSAFDMGYMTQSATGGMDASSLLFYTEREFSDFRFELKARYYEEYGHMLAVGFHAQLDEVERNDCIHVYVLAPGIALFEEGDPTVLEPARRPGHVSMGDWIWARLVVRGGKIVVEHSVDGLEFVDVFEYTLADYERVSDEGYAYVSVVGMTDIEYVEISPLE